MSSRNSVITAAGIAITLTFCGAAQSQPGGQPNIVMIEIFGCNYNDNNDFGDLTAVSDRWNEWADEQDITDYTANLMRPYLYSPAFPYDVVWLGVYPSAEAMGAGQAIWLRDGQEMNAEFGEVVSCSVHGQFAGTATHIPGNGPQPEDDMVNLIAFSDCSLINESSGIEALAAHRQWGDYLADNGSDNFMGALFPVAGENPGADYDYKSIVNFPSAEAWGNHLGTIIPGGLQRAGQIFGRVTQCDTPRVYTTMTVREMAQD